MGNSFIFPVPKSNYTRGALDPFYIEIPKIIPQNESKTNAESLNKEMQGIPALYFRSQVKTQYLLIYTHGNSEDIGRLYFTLLDYFERFQIDVLAPEYPGYGNHKGKPSATSLVKTVEQTVLFATSPEGLGYDLNNVIMIGRSIGTGVAVEIAAKHRDLKGLILISPFLSIREVAQNAIGVVSKMFISDIFKNYTLIDKIKCPILFIHGKKDRLIPFYHSVSLYHKAKSAKKLVLSDEMDHNRTRIERDIYKPMENFLTEDLLIKIVSPFQQQSSEEELMVPEIKELTKQVSTPVEAKKSSKNKKSPLIPLEFLDEPFKDESSLKVKQTDYESPKLIKSQSSTEFHAPHCTDTNERCNHSLEKPVSNQSTPETNEQKV